jgi:hypothetical protein
MADAALFDRIVADLKSRGIKESAIEQARKYWVTVPAHANPLPCPFCYLGGRAGTLVPTSAHDGLDRVKCRECGEIIQLSPA